MLDTIINPRVQAEGQPVAGGVDRVDYLVKFVGFESGHMQDRPENLALQIGDACDFDQGRGDKSPAIGCREFRQNATLATRLRNVIGNALAGGLVDHGTHIGGKMPGHTKAQRVHRTSQHAGEILGDVFLNIEAAQRGAALARRLKCAFNHRLNGLLRQGGAVHDHRVEPAGFGNERRAGRAVLRHGGADAQRCCGGAGKGHPADARIRCQQSSDIPAAGQQLQSRARHPGLMQDFHGKIGA
nr:hypothetical protein [Roseobacter litoralis]